MRRYLYILAVLLLAIPAVVWANWFVMNRPTPYSWTNSPFLFAWDIESGLYGFKGNGSRILGVNNAGNLVTGQYWEYDADNDRLTWTLVEGDIDVNGTLGLTVWVEVLIPNLAATAQIFQLGTTNGGNYWVGSVINTEKPYSSWAPGVETLGAATATSIGVWVTLGYSIMDDGAAVGNDHAVSWNKGANWGEEDDDRGDWALGTLNRFLIGADTSAGPAETVLFRKAVVLYGYKTKCPW